MWYMAWIMDNPTDIGRISAMVQGGLRYFQFDPDKGPGYSFFDFPCTTAGCEASAVKQLSHNAPIYNATSTDLRGFKHRKGKMIMYTGWQNAVAHPYAHIHYYEHALQDTPGGRDFFRFYLVPGMGHCSAGSPNHNDFGMLFPQLENWVERGVAPEAVVTTAKTGSVPTRTRIICPYPQVAKYKGAGFDSDKAESFTCEYPDYPIPQNDWNNITVFPWDERD
jgi:feruloyl esterase